MVGETQEGHGVVSLRHCRGGQGGTSELRRPDYAPHQGSERIGDVAVGTGSPCGVQEREKPTPSEELQGPCAGADSRGCAGRPARPQGQGPRVWKLQDGVVLGAVHPCPVDKVPSAV